MADRGWLVSRGFGFVVDLSGFTDWLCVTLY